MALCSQWRREKGPFLFPCLRSGGYPRGPPILSPCMCCPSLPRLGFPNRPAQSARLAPCLVVGQTQSCAWEKRPGRVQLRTVPASSLHKPPFRVSFPPLLLSIPPCLSFGIFLFASSKNLIKIPELGGPGRKLSGKGHRLHKHETRIETPAPRGPYTQQLPAGI